MKITSANIEHAWLHGQKAKGRAGNVSFEGPDVFSYSTIMGRVVVRPDDPNAPGLVLVNSRKYSVTTSGHQCGIRYAIPGHWVRLNYEGGSGSYYGYGSGDPGDAASLIRAQWDERKAELLKMQHHSEWAARADLAYMHTLQAAAKLLGSRSPLGIRRYNLDAFADKLPWGANAERWAKAEAIAKRRSEGAQKAAATHRANKGARWEARQAQYKLEQAERSAKAAERLGAWKEGADVSIYGYMGPVVLRVKDDTVQTSNGADIPLQAAQMIFKAWKAGKLLPGQHAGAYTVREVAPDHFIAGCTRIDRSEADSFAASQGW